MAGGVNPLLSGAGSPSGGTFCSLNIEQEQELALVHCEQEQNT